MTSFRANPVAVVAAVRVVIYALTTFGLITWTDIQTEAVLLVVTIAIIPSVEFLTGLFLRSQVTTDETLRRAGTSRQQVKDVAASDYAQMMPVVDARLQGYDRHE